MRCAHTHTHRESEPHVSTLVRYDAILSGGGEYKKEDSFIIKCVIRTML